MALCEHVYRRGAVYYWRRRLPRFDDAASAGKVLVRSLRTTDPAEARLKARRLSYIVERIFHKMKVKFFRDLNAAEKQELVDRCPG